MNIEFFFVRISNWHDAHKKYTHTLTIANLKKTTFTLSTPINTPFFEKFKNKWNQQMKYENKNSFERYSNWWDDEKILNKFNFSMFGLSVSHQCCAYSLWIDLESDWHRPYWFGLVWWRWKKELTTTTNRSIVITYTKSKFEMAVIH